MPAARVFFLLDYICALALALPPRAPRTHIQDIQERGNNTHFGADLRPLAAVDPIERRAASLVRASSRKIQERGNNTRFGGNNTRPLAAADSIEHRAPTPVPASRVSRRNTRRRRRLAGAAASLLSRRRGNTRRRRSLKAAAWSFLIRRRRRRRRTPLEPRIGPRDFTAINAMHWDKAAVYTVKTRNSYGQYATILNMAYGGGQGHTSVTINQDNMKMSIRNSNKLNCALPAPAWATWTRKFIGIMIANYNPDNRFAPRKCSDIGQLSLGHSLESSNGCSFMIGYALHKVPGMDASSGTVITYFSTIKDGKRTVRKLQSERTFGSGVGSVEFSNCGASETSTMITVADTVAMESPNDWNNAVTHSIHPPKTVGLTKGKVSMIGIVGEYGGRVKNANAICAGCSVFHASGASTSGPSLLFTAAAVGLLLHHVATAV